MTEKRQEVKVMYKQCKTERSKARQKLIGRTLFDMMHKRPYEDITVTDLCAELKMPRKAFYRYFDDKESALDCLVANTLAEFPSEQVITQSPRLLHREIEGFFEFWLRRKELLEILDKNGKITKIMEQSISFPLESVVPMQRLLPDDEESMREKIYRFAVGGLISIVIDWYRDGFKEPASDVARLAVRILTKPPFPNLKQFGMADV